MNQFFIVPPAEPTSFESRLSPSLALVYLLPMVNVSHRFPGLEPWVQGFSDRFTPEERADYSLITILLYRGMSRLDFDESAFESVEAMLTVLRETEESALQQALLQGICPRDASEAEEPLSLLNSPARLDELLRSIPSPTPDEPVDLNVERAAYLLHHPAELKALFDLRLRRLWEDHLEPHWDRALPAMRQSAVAIRRHFGKGSPAQVFHAVTGRPMPEPLAASVEQIKHIVFYPCPFLGPYLSYGRSRRQEVLRVGYGLGIQPAGAGESAESQDPLPGGLLPALEALADETRLQILASIRDGGQKCAQDFMNEMGLSQPAVSRHMRLLETTGILLVERVNGVKWYRINPARATHVAASVRQFLVGG